MQIFSNFYQRVDISDFSMSECGRHPKFGIGTVKCQGFNSKNASCVYFFIPTGSHETNTMDWHKK